MRAYLDTNVYRMAAERRQADQLRRCLDDSNVTVLASETNMIEVSRAPQTNERREAIRALVTVATMHTLRPVAYLHAQELRFALGKFRREWLHPAPRTSAIKAFLRMHATNWSALARGEMPPDPADDAYRHAAEPTIARTKAARKKARELLRKETGTIRLARETPTGLHVIATLDTDDAEAWWRANCMATWRSAIVGRAPASRDYQDYLGPYLTPQAFRDEESYERFWLRDVPSDLVPRNRLTGIVEHYQLQHRPQHGDAHDSLHANHLLDFDLFITGDRALASVLSATSKQLARAARVCLIDRAAASVETEVSRCLSL